MPAKKKVAKKAAAKTRAPMSPEKQLALYARFGRNVLRLMETQDWNADFCETLQAAAAGLGLADVDARGRFKQKEL